MLEACSYTRYISIIAGLKKSSENSGIKTKCPLESSIKKYDYSISWNF